MEVRSRVAATAAGVIPFSCIICFDEFTTDTRPPMVLPCGHTFVCLPCSKRLKRCMECREPLFLPRQPQQQQQPQTPNRYSSTSGSTSSNSNGNNRRYSPVQHHHHQYYQPPSTPPPPLAPAAPLPIPKNVVLLAMMEAAERQQAAVRREGDDEENQDDDDEEQFDLNGIIGGMVTFAGPTGTYIVRESTGNLAVVPTDPRIAEHEEKKQEEPIALQEGQRVQVVDFEDGVARLARDEGFIVANSSQLVKGVYIVYIFNYILCLS